MPTFNRRAFAPRAIEYFLRQDYPDKELIIVDHGPDLIEDLIPADPRIRYRRCGDQITLGAKRNLACQEARGEIILHWDDDDWEANWRISYQVESLLKERADICGLDKVYYYDPAANRAWQYIYPIGGKPWVGGNTLCYRKSVWQENPFPNIHIEDTRFIWSCVTKGKKVLALPDSSFFVAMIHDSNVSPKRTQDGRYHPCSVDEIRKVMGEDWGRYSRLPEKTGLNQTNEARPTALVAAARGVGDILRATPLIRVFARMGYAVDVLVAPDYPESAKLLEGAPEIRNLFQLPSPWRRKGERKLEGLEQNRFDVAAFTVWGAEYRNLIQARRSFVFEKQEWRREGDNACVEKIARELGWREELPEPFAMASARRFDLPAGTIALHPGCKPDWPWKKWHGFDELAAMFPNVAIIGMPEDLNNEATYFKRGFQWPEHARNFVGKLSLTDTAALLRECAALVSNDSGLMHLGVAMGTPTFGVFGLTSPQREMMRSPKMIAVTKRLACEPVCRQRPWGRRDCEHHLECLKTLTAEEVRRQIAAVISPESSALSTRRVEIETMDELSVIYYGYVFDASGYGEAARAYIHALHTAGVEVSVVDLANRERQVNDKLIESLVGRPLTPDFHLFHGIPPQWSRLAFRLPNAVGITVWETDQMPSQWRNALNHVLEVWLPCDFNVATFQSALEKPVFKLPHAILPKSFNGDVPEPDGWLGVRPRDFVFYSIFEWQDRKNPQGAIEAYLRAFADKTAQDDVVLIIKSNPGAEVTARATLAQARERTGSQARVELRCAAWSEPQIEALQRRGDCYLSLHRGEGWCYPLFEAARRGKPVVATEYSGPLEYLDSQHHHLVRCEAGVVKQQYAYYNPQMRWAEPDLEASSRSTRAVYDRRDAAREQASKAAPRIEQDYSLETIGAQARGRLLNLLRHTNLQKFKRLEIAEKEQRLKPLIPIPGDWYDQDYFENGLKSNWERGYSWHQFSGLFTETAKFLTEIFSEAESFLDVGCAKGFLIRTLREKGKECYGFDHSPWAVDRADDLVKPFVIRGGVDDVSFDRRFDVLLALSLFESLTEEQATSFLSRASAWTGQAILATIPCAKRSGEQPHCQEDRDLSHITMRTRAWWNEIFLKAGWRQDALHRIAQRACQEHPLVRRMEWQVFVYAPR
jgi:ADP-heptose:LPS heptosyltransferase/2-polyprenyl-3-methyl-5-hydroxy-6-metoxy-1,4-benzoquinol methylase